MERPYDKTSGRNSELRLLRSRNHHNFSHNFGTPGHLYNLNMIDFASLEGVGGSLKQIKRFLLNSQNFSQISDLKVRIQRLNSRF